MEKNSTTTTTKIKVYRDNRLDRWQSLKPHLEEFGNKIDYFFTKGHWPKQDDAQI